MNYLKINRRINKVIGQLNAINRMLQRGENSDDILIQINASKKAIHKIGQIIVEEELKKKIQRDINGDTIEDIIKSFEKTLDLYFRL